MDTFSHPLPTVEEELTISGFNTLCVRYYIIVNTWIYYTKTKRSKSSTEFMNVNFNLHKYKIKESNTIRVR